MPGSIPGASRIVLTMLSAVWADATIVGSMPKVLRAAVVAGPTGGYVIGFLLAPMLVGKLISRRNVLWWQILVFYLGSQVILGLGVIHLTIFHTRDLAQAVAVGYVPFVPGDILKILAATSIYRSYTALRRARRG